METNLCLPIFAWGNFRVDVFVSFLC